MFFTTQKAKEELISSTQKEEEATQKAKITTPKPLTTTQNAILDNVGQPVSDHFIDVNKKVELGSGAFHEIDDVMLNAAVRKMLTERGIIPKNIPAAEDVKKVERRLTFYNYHPDFFYAVSRKI